MKSILIGTILAACEHNLDSGNDLGQLVNGLAQRVSLFLPCRGGELRVSVGDRVALEHDAVGDGAAPDKGGGGGAMQPGAGGLVPAAHHQRLERMYAEPFPFSQAQAQAQPLAQAPAQAPAGTSLASAAPSRPLTFPSCACGWHHSVIPWAAAGIDKL